MIDFDDLGVCGIAQGVAARQLLPTEVVEEAILRINTWEGRIHAWSYLDTDAARREAERQTEEAAVGQLRGPLHGVPIGIKDEFLVSGMPCGMRGPGSEPETSDSNAVARLRAAGAVIMGMTHMQIDGVPPPTRNPWNADHTAGGSSSGSGAAVGARMVPAALALQMGGSCLRPAAYCGVVGMKPTYGRIGRYGAFPFAWSLDHPGVITLNVADAALILSVLAGPDPRDSTCLNEDAPPSRIASLATPPRVGVVRNHFYDHTEAETASGLFAAIERLTEAGAQTSDVLLPDSFTLTWPAHRMISAAERTLIPPVVPSGRGGGSARVGALIPATYYLQARRVRRWLQQELTSCWADYEVLAMPATPAPAPAGMPTGDASLLIPWSLLGYPSISLPFGFASNGLPLAMQLVTPYGKDHSLLQVASWVEGVLGRLPEPSLASAV